MNAHPNKKDHEESIFQHGLAIFIVLTPKIGFDLQGLVMMSLRSANRLVKISLYFNSIKFPRLSVGLVALMCIIPFGFLEAKSPPDSFADLAAKLLPSVVNISTMQAVEARSDPRQNMPQFPPG